MTLAARTKLAYKFAGHVELLLHAFWAEKQQEGTPVPAIVFFFGGAWKGGRPEQFFPQCAYLASRGMAAFSAEYRVQDKHGVSPLECAADAKSAIRWIRSHALDLNIDANRIVAAGGSSGGHLAACTGIISGFDEPDEDLSITSVPNALILFNPGLDLTGKKAKGHAAENLSEEQKKAISPMFHIQAGSPPAIIFHGTEDEVVPFTTVERFARLTQEAGNFCELVPFVGKEHGFFNYGRHGNGPYAETLDAADRFLSSLGYLDGPPTIMKWTQGAKETTPADG